MEKTKTQSYSSYPSKLSVTKQLSSASARRQRQRQPSDLSNQPAGEILKSGISMNFVLFKWLLVFIFSLVLTFAMLQIRRSSEDSIDIKHFPLFLSHWGLILNEITAIYAAFLFTILCIQRNKTNYYSLGSCFNIYRILHYTSTVLSSFITFAYWMFIHDDDMLLDFICIITHVFNTVLMLADFIISAVCYYFYDIVYTITLALAYTVFTLFHYLFGGTDGKGNRYIYKLIDWSKPKDTLLFVSTFLVTVVVIHVLLWTTSVIKTFIRNIIVRRIRSHFEKV